MNEELAQYLATQEGLDPGVLAMTLKALSPKTPWAGTIGEGGETKFTYMPPETKAAKEKEKGQAQPGQPAKAGGIGFDPATAALMAPPGEPISAASLRGLTPEQIMGVMGTEAEAERLRQGTIGQLMELPYRQALTERAMRPDVSLEVARIQKELGPEGMLKFVNAALQFQALGRLSGKSMEELKDMPPELLTRAGVPASLISEIFREPEALEERMYQEPDGKYYWGLFKPGEVEPTKAKLRKATKRDLEWKEIEVSPLAREKFERLKEMDASGARELIARQPKFKGNKEFVHTANRDSKDTTLYIWEDPGMLGFGGGARKVKLPKGMMAGHFEPDMTDRLAAGETIGPFKHPTTGARIMLQLVDDEVKIVK